ncbi:regulator of chromosome condensation 1/beta-lactamase-inhibitor protein II [Blastocladiella britannica]|nr:regulator of chromosome condensation 1/beta-lactamase-inhibitor protein II [Blastocladiella britannica]
MYAWGANTCGQLALGHTRDLPLPTLVTTRQGSEQVAPALPPTMICGGANHSLLVDAAGHLWAAGSNEHGQLGVPTPTLIIAPWTDVAVSANPAAARVPCALHWIRVPLPSDAAAIAHIAAGWAHSLVLLVSGVVIAAGDNTHGQCGTTGPRFRFEPVALLPGRTRAIAAGMRHSVALSTDGRVFAWGASRHGQCGVAISPTGSIGEIPVPASTRATGVAAGARHTLMALLYYERPGATLALAVGDNKHGQLGRPAADAGSVPVIRILDDATASDPVRHVHCGWHHSTLVTASGRVWTFGRNTHGQLGRPSGGRFDPVPRSLALPGPVHSIVAGAEHMLALVASPSTAAVGPMRRHWTAGPLTLRFPSRASIFPVLPSRRLSRCRRTLTYP